LNDLKRGDDGLLRRDLFRNRRGSVRAALAFLLGVFLLSATGQM